ncbi:MAG: transglycosylase domain-containing protein [Methylobacter sp.]|nr:transglycosylase domain-containing protein [Methylococcales bacterium]MDD5113699.1 transglycosylase domain-containing protein [Methylobacter sp.]
MFRKLPSWLIKASVALIGIPALVVSVWYAVSFLPYLSEINTYAKQGEEIVKDVNPMLYQIAVASETKEGIRSYAMSRAYSDLVYQKNRKSMLSWHANNVLWHFASYLHFDDRQIFNIWVACSLRDCGLGLKEAAQVYLGKEINSLSVKELSTLMAVVRSPSMYKPGTESGKQRTNQILEKIEKPSAP